MTPARAIYVIALASLLALAVVRQSAALRETGYRLEQLRAIEHGFDIIVAKVKHTADGIDTPAQYAEFVKRYKSK